MRTTLLFAGLALLAGCKTITVEERHIIRPDALSGKAPKQRLDMPGVEELELARPDGAVLKGVLLQKPGAKLTVLYFGGNLFHLDDAGDKVAAALAPCDVNLAMVDYRGYGRSSGTPTVANMTDDALATFDYLNQRYPDAVAVHGQSLGSFVAAQVARQRNVAGLVLESTTTNARDMVNGSIPWYFKPFIQVSLAPSLQAIDNTDVVSHVQAPTLVLTGDADKDTPPALALKVFDALPSRHKRFLLTRGAGHNDVLSNPATAGALCPFLRDPAML
ncbi:alpha/beta fold hydrolase [Duganella sp. FT92W]|uniref:Alpha/beta fold hydrolase n=1 Tax=Pseudoduganella rivuli TaxID=2666085 RepID=A0A7X2LX85_9BURK|nr:alpha/beta fold hydrolase [Pseudoduganella rivuli]MRV75644.1 alpha/beta fold hydrolase [Pseudoduganella rivuli]